MHVRVASDSLIASRMNPALHGKTQLLLLSVSSTRTQIMSLEVIFTDSDCQDIKKNIHSDS